MSGDLCVISVLSLSYLCRPRATAKLFCDMGCPGEVRGAPQPRATAKLFWDLGCPLDVPVSSGELRSRVLLQSYSGIWSVRWMPR